MNIDAVFLRQFHRDESGAVAVIVALLLVVLLGFTALGVDVASLYRDRARLQAVGDLTAMSAVAAPDDATARASKAMARNGGEKPELNRLQLGRFLRNPEIPPQDRFLPLSAGTPGINAVAVTLGERAPLHFAKIFSDETDVGLTRRSLAIRTGAVSFSLGSHIARLDAANLSEALSGSFGTSVSLSAGDVDVLADAEFDMGDLLVALDNLTGIGSRNPAAILEAETTAADVLTALQSVLPSGAAGILGPIVSAAPDTSVPVASLVGGIDVDLGLTAAEFASEIEISPVDVLRSLLGANPVNHGLNLGLAVQVPGVLDTSVQLSVGEPPAQSGWIALGEEGVQLHRAAVRLHSNTELSVSLLGDLGLGVTATALHLPIYLEAAGATATLEQMTCAGTDPADVVARFRTGPTPLHPLNGTSVAALYLGELPGNQMAGGAIDPSTLDFADFLNLSIRVNLLLVNIEIDGLTLQARSHVALGQSQEQTVDYTRDDIANGRMTRHFASGDLLSTGVQSLLSPQNTELRVKPGQQGLLGEVVGPLIANVLAILPERLLASVAGPLDSVLNGTLNAAGLRLGEGELTLTGHHCERVQLVR
ncbi:putative membrane protein [Sulfitobacter noctilucae]|uniref:TadG family pilus assembly protein n=1 Tax=Sulfitobacter noctilucae TaxID=1342302 RepID=UPI0004687333|nr:pilus assembly protein TadG-related protein [Sulfitobacter noctilucae]KIN70667.1 putative membrane protein [Sulfitobacter noctilucae]